MSLPLIPASFFDFPHDFPYDFYATLATNEPFSTLDLEDEKNPWLLRSRPSTPVLSSNDNTPSTKDSDISEIRDVWMEDLQVPIDINDVDIPDPWPLHLDAQLSEEDLQALMDTGTVEKVMGSLDGILDPFMLGSIRSHPPSSEADQGYRHGEDDQSRIENIPKRRAARESTPLPTIRDSKNYSTTRTKALECLEQPDIHVNSCSMWQEDRSRNLCSNALKAGHAACKETKESERDDELSQITDTLLESIEFSPQTANPDHFSNESARHLQLPGAQRDGKIDLGDFEESGVSMYEVETEEEGPSLWSGSSAIEDTQLEESPTFDVDWFLSNALIQVNDLLLQELVNHAAFEPTDGLEGSESKKRARESSPPLPSSLSSQASDQPPQKRLRGSGRDPGDDGESGDDKNEDNKPPKRNEKPVLLGFPIRRLKCPFNQRSTRERHAEVEALPIWLN